MAQGTVDIADSEQGTQRARVRADVRGRHCVRVLYIIILKEKFRD